MVAIMMALSCSMTFVSCSDDDNDSTQDDNGNNSAQNIAGAYSGYSIGESRMFTDYLMGDDASATITANEDGTINLVYKSGAGDFVLNNLEVADNSFSGEGQVTLAMGGGPGSSYEYTLEGSVSNDKVLTLKAVVPAVMGGMTVNFIQGETPITYYVAATYRYNCNLALTVGESTQGSTTDCSATITRATDTTVNIALNGFDKLEGGRMSIENFTINGVNVTKNEDGSYTLQLGTFEAQSGSIILNGTSVEGTIAADGTASVTTVFKPGVMPMDITASFSGSKNNNAE